MNKKEHNRWRKSFPYFKVQYWDGKVKAWHDIQKRFDTPEEAQAYADGYGGVTRLMKIYRNRREVV